MKTVTLQIGNSDNKLTQQEWAKFVHRVDFDVRACAKDLHFMGAPPTWFAWQNVCWVFSASAENLAVLKDRVIEHRTHWFQESVAWTEGETQFV